MQRAANSIGRGLAVMVLAVLLMATPVRVHAAPAGTIRIAPAAIRLELDHGADSVVSTIAITNTYAAPVSVHLSVERSDQNIASSPADPTTLVSLSAADMTIPAGQSANEVITLRDSKNLSPGSQVANLVVAQSAAGASAGVGVLPAVRLPITIIKDDGAIRSLGLTNVASPRFTMGVPASITVTAKNTGNVIAIPRGTVRITDARGELVGQGTLNTASAALQPGSELAIPVPITAITDARLPGTYTVAVSYGLGGDATDKTTDRTYFFIAWWHIAITLLAIGLLLYLVRSLKRVASYMRHFRKRPGPSVDPNKPKRRILIGRNA